MRLEYISFDILEGWESWTISVTDPNAPVPMTAEWLLNNRDSWDWEVQEDGSTDMDTSTLKVW